MTKFSFRPAKSSVCKRCCSLASEMDTSATTFPSEDTLGNNACRQLLSPENERSSIIEPQRWRANLSNLSWSLNSSESGARSAGGSKRINGGSRWHRGGTDCFRCRTAGLQCVSRTIKVKLIGRYRCYPRDHRSDRAPGGRPSPAFIFLEPQFTLSIRPNNDPRQVRPSRGIF